MKPLFIVPSMVEEDQSKLAAEADLPADANAWPQAILQEAYKQVPYLSDFSPTVHMLKANAERGYAMGSIEVQNQTQAPPTASPESLSNAGVRSVRIPVIIKDRRLQPLDILISDAGSPMPLTEMRLRQALFRPQMFDVTSQTPGDSSMVGQLYPPYRMNYGMGGGGAGYVTGIGKTAEELQMELLGITNEVAPQQEKKACVEFRTVPSMLQVVADTITTQDANDFLSKLAESPSVVAAVHKNIHAFEAPLRLLSKVAEEDKGAAKLAGFLMNEPDVAQVSALGEHQYRVKLASVSGWNPSLVDLDRGALVDAFGTKVAMDVDIHGSVTLHGKGKEADDAPDERSSVRPATSPGLYKVWQEGSDGKELIGAVIPSLLGYDGKPLPLALFTNGSVSAVQSEIVGVPVGGVTTLQSSTTIRGTGVFFTLNGQGQITATLPMTVQHSAKVSDGERYYMATVVDGSLVEFKLAPVRALTVAPGGKVLIPENWKWAPLGASALVPLLGGVELSAQVSSEKKASVVIRALNPYSVSLEGDAVEKLAHEDREGVSMDDALFLLAGLGLDARYGAQKVAESLRTNAPVEVSVPCVARPYSEKMAARQGKVDVLRKEAAALRRDLLKEAAFIPDPNTVDAVLSLGFVNPENIMTYTSCLPTLEQAQRKLVELLLGVRAGIPSIPVFSLERAIRAMEEVIVGLKTLAFQGE